MPAKLKDPEVRARKNRASTAAELTLPASASAKLKKPPLTATILGIRGAVKPQVQRWWAVVWQSPMAPRWLDADVEVLYVCAQIRQQMAVFMMEGKSVASLAAELRQQENRVGLDLQARRRLDWRIAGPTAPAPEVEEPEPQEAPDEQDPRRLLRAVK